MELHWNSSSDSLSQDPWDLRTWMRFVRFLVDFEWFHDDFENPNGNERLEATSEINVLAPFLNTKMEILLGKLEFPDHFTGLQISNLKGITYKIDQKTRILEDSVDLKSRKSREWPPSPVLSREQTEEESGVTPLTCPESWTDRVQRGIVDKSLGRGVESPILCGISLGNTSIPQFTTQDRWGGCNLYFQRLLRGARISKIAFWTVTKLNHSSTSSGVTPLTCPESWTDRIPLGLCF